MNFSICENVYVWIYQVTKCVMAVSTGNVFEGILFYDFLPENNFSGYKMAYKTIRECFVPTPINIDSQNRKKLSLRIPEDLKTSIFSSRK